MIFGVAILAYVLIMFGAIQNSEYPRKREISRTYDIVKATIAGILSILILSWALILKTGFKWPW